MSNILRSQSGQALLANVGGNLRRLRLAASLSQSALAQKSGLSRRMIVAIEGGEANISLSSLDRLAAALGVRLTEMVRAPEAPDGRRIEAFAWQGASADSRAVLLGAAPGSRETELWIWSLGEGERYPSEAGSGDWHEMLVVIEGVLAVEAQDGRHEIAPGDFLIFSSAAPYIFANAGTGIVRFLRNVVL